LPLVVGVVVRLDVAPGGDEVRGQTGVPCGSGANIQVCRVSIKDVGDAGSDVLQFIIVEIVAGVRAMPQWRRKKEPAFFWCG
jgi:hypothetical protein